jgi:hypothetical protein
MRRLLVMALVLAPGCRRPGALDVADAENQRLVRPIADRDDAGRCRRPRLLVADLLAARLSALSRRQLRALFTAAASSGSPTRCAIATAAWAPSPSMTGWRRSSGGAPTLSHIAAVRRSSR